MPKRIVTIVFLSLEAIIYLCFISIEIFLNQNVLWLKYVGILLCLIYAIYLCAIDLSADRILVALAVLLACIADLFSLALVQAAIEMGSFFFIFVQIVYFVRLVNYKKTRYELSIALRVDLVFLAIVLEAQFFELSLLIALALFCFGNLLVNLVTALIFRQNIFALALAFLLLSELCVGIYYLGSSFIMLNSFFMDIARYGVWAFYLPSQVILCLSGKTQFKKNCIPLKPLLLPNE